MINSDEVTVQNKSGNPNAYAFRLPHEKHNKELVNKGDHVKPTISMMFWAGIWPTGRTSILSMTRDQTARKKGYSGWSYRKVLGEGLLPHYDGTRVFQQDNARIHTSEATMTWLLEYGIELLDWPPHSPDLSPIENIWSILKRQLRKKYTHLQDLKNNEADRAELQRCVEEVWRAIPQEQIFNCIKSLEKRLRACIRARGWYTKY